MSKGYTAAAFGPGNPITRQELSAILYRYARWQGPRRERVRRSGGLYRPARPLGGGGCWLGRGRGLLTGKGGGVLDPRAWPPALRPRLSCSAFLPEANRQKRRPEPQGSGLPRIFHGTNR